MTSTGFIYEMSPMMDVDLIMSMYRTLSLVFLAGVFVAWLWNRKEKEVLLPPGPKGWPFVGMLPLFDKLDYEEIMEMKDKYGDIFTFKYSGHRYVVLGNYELIKEALCRQGVNFSARIQDWTLFNFIAKNSGLTSSEGDLWREHKRFMMTSLRDAGFGNVKMEGAIIQEIQKLVRFIEKSEGKPCGMEDVMVNCAFNIICSLLCSRSYEFDDPEFWKIRMAFRQSLKATGSMNFMRPRLLSSLLPMTFSEEGRTVKKSVNILLPLFKKWVQEHEETFEENHMRDYIDEHIAKRKRAEAAGDKRLTEYFSNDHLETLFGIMVFAALETTPLVLSWGFYFVSTHPEIQAKIQEELDRVVGHDRLPSYRDLSKLPYTEAIINESLRIASLQPLSLFHQNFEETVVSGYKIPARSIIIPCLFAAHRDPAYWPAPDEFNPENFLNSEGAKAKKESFIPFSMGKRACPGESLARMEMFFFFTLVMRKFNLRFVEQEIPFPRMEQPAFSRLLGRFQVIATPRSIKLE